MNGLLLHAKEFGLSPPGAWDTLRSSKQVADTVRSGGWEGVRGQQDPWQSLHVSAWLWPADLWMNLESSGVWSRACLVIP